MVYWICTHTHTQNTTTHAQNQTKLATKEIFTWNPWASILELGTLQNNYNKVPGPYLTLTFALP